MNIYEKLLTIQQTIRVPKDQNNDFAGFKYRSAEDILEKLKPLLLANKVIVILTDEVQEVAGSAYIKATARMIDTEQDSETISVTAYAREEKTRPKMSEGQLTGAASSYARKYALNGLLLLDDNKDPDSQDNRPQAHKKPQTKADPLAKAKGEIMAKFQASGLNTVQQKAAIMRVLKKSTVDTIEEANEVLQALEDGIV